MYFCLNIWLFEYRLEIAYFVQIKISDFECLILALLQKLIAKIKQHRWDLPSLPMVVLVQLPTCDRQRRKKRNVPLVGQAILFLFCPDLLVKRNVEGVVEDYMAKIEVFEYLEERSHVVLLDDYIGKLPENCQKLPNWRVAYEDSVETLKNLEQMLVFLQRDPILSASIFLLQSSCQNEADNFAFLSNGVIDKKFFNELRWGEDFQEKDAERMI